MKWTIQEIEKIKKFTSQGLNSEEIATKINRTAKSIRLKLNRIGFNFLKLNPCPEKETRICNFCKKEFKAHKWDVKKFCNRSCSGFFNNSKRNPPSIETKNKVSESLKIHYSKNEHWSVKNLSIKQKELKKIEKNIYCLECGNKIECLYKKKFCNDTCIKLYRRKKTDCKKQYRFDCAFKFSLSSYPNEFDFELIKKHGWYRPKNRGDNPNGVSRDHMFSIDEGFKNNVDPNIISHPANCELMIHNQNNKKNRKSSITLEELKERIKNWDLKYKF
jgi:hypothetical protein